MTQITYPLNGACLTAAPRIIWSETPGAAKYYLYVGTSLGAKNIIDTGEMAPSTLEVQWPVPNGITLYARVHALVGGVWVAAPDITFSVVGDLKPVRLTSQEIVQWHGKQLVAGSNTKDAKGNYPEQDVVADPASSSVGLPFTVPPDAWLGITYAAVTGKFGNHDRTGYLVMEGVASASESHGPFQPPYPALVAPNTIFRPCLINNTPEAEYMDVFIQAVLYRGDIPAQATLRDVLQAV